MPNLFIKPAVVGDGKSKWPSLHGNRHDDTHQHSLFIDHWKYDTFKPIESVGATPDDQTAGCAREAMKIALECCPLATSDVVEKVATWEDWVGFKDLVTYVEDLNKVCNDGNRHSLLDLSSSKRRLLLSRLGRMRLWKARFCVVVLRPVMASTGWAKHCITMTASPSGDWTLHDPATNSTVVLWDSLPPRYKSIAGAYVVLVRLRVVHLSSSSRQNKATKHIALKQQIPLVPTPLQICDDFLCAILDRQFFGFIQASGLLVKSIVGDPFLQTYTAALGDTEGISTISSFTVWKRLITSYVDAQIEYAPVDVLRLQLRPPELRTFYLLGASATSGSSLNVQPFILYAINHKVRIFCPQKLEFKPFEFKPLGLTAYHYCQQMTICERTPAGTTTALALPIPCPPPVPYFQHDDGGEEIYDLTKDQSSASKTVPGTSCIGSKATVSTPATPLQSPTPCVGVYLAKYFRQPCNSENGERSGARTAATVNPFIFTSTHVYNFTIPTPRQFPSRRQKET